MKLCYRPAFIFFCVLYSILSQSARAQSILSLSLLKQLDSVALQDVPPNAPGIATAIILDGEVVYKKYGGFASFTDSSLIGPGSRFNIASNGKQFTALAVLLLESQKKMNLRDDIRKFLPGFLSSVKSKITVADLLNHTSGIRDVYDLWSLQGVTWWKQSFRNTDALDLLMRQQDLNFKPGSKYLYSNSNYILLAMIVEKASGRSFVEFTDQLFRDLHMPNTSFENDHRYIRGPVARAYFNFNEWTTYDWKWDVCGDGNLFSTLEDQLQWEKLLQGKGTSSISKRILIKSQQSIRGSQWTNYGFGLEAGKYKGLSYLFHEGATGAWKATVLRFPSAKLSMITMTNTGKSIPSMQTRQMADLMLGLNNKPGAFAVRPVQAGPYVAEEEITGVYLTPENFSFLLEKQNGKLFLKRIGRNDIELEREQDNIFHQRKDTAFKQEFTRSDDGELQLTAYYTTHAPYTLRKVTANWSGFDPACLNGEYLNDETDTKMSIGYTADKNYSVKIGRADSTTGLLITPVMMLVNNYVIRFNCKNGISSSVSLDGDRIKNVVFTKVK
ncbi:serine hydrolase [Terrimonas sp. NA20]|uniref:Serine hydrolase n=1 Tax=Terrimonas ginsenosidimutans TaxID=2908004 RepID=A0ABS9KSC9_9BACT|nr:serine hydrolase domain-containing protein [Terrimonas ginsenosidimutans]MCG2615197.1 serine hydrolase [Terrimonas ginsenosidimutans]